MATPQPSNTIPIISIVAALAMLGVALITAAEETGETNKLVISILSFELIAGWAVWHCAKYMRRYVRYVVDNPGQAE